MFAFDEYENPEYEDEYEDDEELSEEQEMISEAAGEYSQIVKYLLMGDWLDEEYMDNLYKRDKEKYWIVAKQLENEYGFTSPIKKDAPEEAVQAYKRAGELRKILNEYGVEVD